MFKAVLFACMMFNPNECYELIDDRGLKPTQAACQQRINEMKNDIKEHLPQFKVLNEECRLMGKSV